MNKYLKSFFPWRWIGITSLFILLQILFYCLHELGLPKDNYILFAISTLPALIILDLIAGIGREAPFLKSLFK